MDSLLDELQCPVCLELFDSPVILSCSHVLCRSPCAERLVNHGFVKCPVCRENTYVADGTASLPRVLPLDNIISQCRDDVSHPTHQSPLCTANDVACQLCDAATPRRAHKTCVDCSASYCERCLLITHPEREPFTRHHLVQPKLQAPPADLKCQLHAERVNVFCQDCRQLGCVLCVGDQDNHPGHHILSIEQAVTFFESELNESTQTLSTNQDTVKEAIEAHQARLTELQHSASARRDHIRDQCDSLTKEVTNKRQLLLSDLDYEETSKSDRLQRLTASARHATATLRDAARQHSQLLEQNEDPIRFIQAAISAHERSHTILAESAQLAANSPEGATNSLNHKVVDFRKEKAILRDMTYLAVPQTPVIDVSRCSRSPSSVVLVLAPPVADSDVIDGYTVYYCSQSEQMSGRQQVMTFKTPGEERKYGRGTSRVSAVCLIQEDLQSATEYHFSTRATNAAGDSEVSHTAVCSTLAESLSTIPVPEICEQQCRVFSSSIHIQSESPLSAPPDQGLSFYLLYREASTPAMIWKSVDMYDRADHRVFGLEPYTRYNFAVMACDKNGECQVSRLTSLSTELAAY